MSHTRSKTEQVRNVSSARGMSSTELFRSPANNTEDGKYQIAETNCTTLIFLFPDKNNSKNGCKPDVEIPVSGLKKLQGHAHRNRRRHTRRLQISASSNHAASETRQQRRKKKKSVTHAKHQIGHSVCFPRNPEKEISSAFLATKLTLIVQQLKVPKPLGADDGTSLWIHLQRR